MKKTGLVLAVVGFIFFCFTEGRGAEWKYLGYTQGAAFWFYVDVTSADRSSKDIVRVWTKRIYDDEGRMDWVAKFGEKYMTLDHSLASIEIHCADKKKRSLSMVLYSQNGKTLPWPEIEKDATWSLILPDSISDDLFQSVCE